jgi:hypothetical protein
MPCCAVDHLRSEREDHSVPVYYHRTNRRAKMAATLQCESMASASPLITSEGFSSTSLPEQFRVMLKNRNARRRRWDKLDGVFAGALPESV